MSTPLPQRLFGIAFKPVPAHTVRELLQRVRSASGQSGEMVIARADDSLADAQALFETHDLHHLPVLDGTRVIGIVSATDLLAFFGRGGFAERATTPLSEVMTKNPEVINEDTPTETLIRRLAHASFRCLPVVRDGGEFVDIVTTRDLVQFLELTMP